MSSSDDATGFKPVRAEELTIGDIVRRTKRAQTRLVTGIRDKAGRLEVVFEDSRFPYSLTSDREAQWWRQQ